MTPGSGQALSGQTSKARLHVEPVARRTDLDRFIRLPHRLYGDAPGFVPPLDLERRQALTPSMNPYFQHAKVRCWIAYRGSSPVGRISAQVDRLYLERYRDATGHFGFLDAEDDAEVFRALTSTAEFWARSEGMRRILGPLSLSTNEESGLLVEGFDERPMMMMGYAPPYAGPRLGEQGYGAAKDLIAYDYDLRTDVPDKVDRAISRARQVDAISARPLDWSRYDAEVALLVDIFNDAWSANWGFVPMTVAEVQALAKAMRPLVRKELVSIASVEGEPAAMIVALPNLCEIIADLDGALLPTGWAKLLWRLRTAPPRSARVALMGVRKRWQGTALGAALMMLVFGAFRDGMRTLDMHEAEFSWVLEDNQAMRSVLEGLGARRYKIYRLYHKVLD